MIASGSIENRGPIRLSRRLIACGMRMRLAVGTDCKCPACSDSPKPSYSPEFRLQAEARHLLTLPLQARREYLASKPVQARREALQQEMARQHAAK